MKKRDESLLLNSKSWIRALLIATAFLGVSCAGPELIAPPGFAFAAEPQQEAPAPQQPPLTLDDAERARLSGQLELYESTLVELSRSEDEATRSRALTLLGMFLVEQGRADQAANALEQAAAVNARLRPFLLLELARMEEQRGSWSRAVEVLQWVLTEAPKSSAATIARLRLPAIHAAAGNRDAAAASLQELKGIRIDELSEESLVKAAEAFDAAGWSDLAAGVRMSLLREFPSGKRTETTYEKVAALGDSSPLARLSFEQSIDLAERLARVNRFPQSLHLFQTIQARFPNRRTAPLLQYARLRALFNSRNYEEVIRSPRLKPRDPSYLAAELLRARAYWRTDRNEEFLSGINSILKKYPASAEATQAKFLLSRYYMIDGRDFLRSARLLEEVIAVQGAGDEGENLWTLGWIYTRAGEDERALATFARYIATYPDADYTTNSLFWTGKIHQRTGNIAGRDAAFRQLITSFPYAYYSYRAREIVEEPLVLPGAVQSSFTFPAVSPQQDLRLQTVQELSGIGLQTYAAQELKAIAGDAPSDPTLAFQLAELHVKTGQPLKAIGILQRNFRDIIRHGGTGVPPQFWELLYPRLYWEHIVSAAEQAQLDPYLVSSIIRQESGFDPMVVSSAGAIGLMQIMPNEAPTIAAGAGLNQPVTRNTLFEPGLNVTIGAAEFVQKLRLMSGNQILAIASYNAGPEAVGRWIASTPLDDVDVFIESIPFNETRLYVKNVIRNHHEYRRIYGNGRAG